MAGTVYKNLLVFQHCDHYFD